MTKKIQITANAFLSNHVKDYLDRVIDLGAGFKYTTSRRWYEFSTTFKITGESVEIDMMKRDFKDYVDFHEKC